MGATGLVDIRLDALSVFTLWVVTLLSTFVKPVAELFSIRPPAVKIHVVSKMVVFMFSERFALICHLNGRSFHFIFFVNNFFSVALMPHRAGISAPVKN
jgi:hypothetical protein